jgi:hypothetical protein
MTKVPGNPSGAAHDSEASPRDRLWPALITAGLILVIIVNALFIFIAVSGADDVVPSYITEER